MKNDEHSSLFVRGKLAKLAEDWGYQSVDLMLEQTVTDSVCPAICMNTECTYSIEYEPDCSDGWCEACGDTTCESAHVLAGLI